MGSLLRYLPSKKTLSVIVTVISVVLTAVCTVELIRRLTAAPDDVANSLLALFSNEWLIVAELLLLLVNISLESLKWWLINGRNYQCYKWWQVVGTVLVATAFGGATPGRVGEHVARMQDGESKSDALIGSLVSSIVQTMVIVLFALVAFLFYHVGQTACELITHDADISIGWFLVVVAVLLVAVSLLFRYVLLRWRNNTYTQRFTARRLCLIFGVNALRYVVFATQLVLLLSYGAETQIWTLYIFSTFYYFLITVLPSINIIDVGVKNEVAIIVFGGMFGEPTIFTAVFVVWLINTCLPSLLGLLYNLGKIFRRIVVA